MTSGGRLLASALALAAACPAASVASQPAGVPGPSEDGGLAFGAPGPGVGLGWPELAEGFPRLGLCRPVAASLARWIGPPPGRSRGLGCPLVGESWLGHPFSAGWFMGSMTGGPLIDDWLGLKTGYTGGYRLGWDVNYYWGLETRLTLAAVPAYDTARAVQAQWDADTAAGLADDDPRRGRLDSGHGADVFQWDASLVYYPWGDSLWRPYLAVGLGVAEVEVMDRLSRYFDETMFALPVAVGLKWRCNERLALRIEVADLMSFPSGSELRTLHNLTYTAGVEVRFGGTRRAYWPWNPGRHYW